MESLLLLEDKVAVSPSLLHLEITVLNNLLLLVDKVVASLSRLFRVVKAEARDKEDRAAVKETKRTKVDTERAKEEDSMAMVSKITVWEATAVMAKAKVQVTGKVERVKVEVSSTVVALRLTLIPSPHPRRVQSKRWIQCSNAEVVTWYKRILGCQWAVFSRWRTTPLVYAILLSISTRQC